MAYETEVHYAINPVESWQRAYWFTVGSPCIFGLACATILQTATIEILENIFHLASHRTLPDDSLETAMDIAIGARQECTATMTKVLTMPQQQEVRALPAVRGMAA